MEQFGIIGLYMAGMALVIAEIILPGVILGIVGAAFVAAGIILGFRQNPALGWTLVAVTILLAPVLAFFWMRFLRRKLAIQTTQEGTSSAQMHLKNLVGQEGVALTPLRPAGAARIGERKVDVVAQIEMIERDARVVVVEVSSNRVVVRRV